MNSLLNRHLLKVGVGACWALEKKLSKGQGLRRKMMFVKQAAKPSQDVQLNDTIRSRANSRNGYLLMIYMLQALAVLAAWGGIMYTQMFHAQELKRQRHLKFATVAMP